MKRYIVVVDKHDVGTHGSFIPTTHAYESVAGAMAARRSTPWAGPMRVLEIDTEVLFPPKPAPSAGVRLLPEGE